MNKIYLYAVDPGAVSVMYPIWEEGKRRGIDLQWAAEGYAEKYLRASGIPYVKDGVKKIIASKQNNAVIVFGSQTNYSRTIELLRMSNQNHLASYFLFDHWCNYVKHFASNGGLVLPSKSVLVMSAAVKKELVKQGIPLSKIRLVGHPAIEQTMARYKRYSKTAARKQILFISEPVRQDYGAGRDKKPFLGYDETSTLSFMLDYLVKNKQTLKAYTVIIKLHPRENPAIVKKAVKPYTGQLRFKIVGKSDPIKIMFDSEYIVGMTSILLMHALAIGKRTGSIQVNRNEQGKLHTNQAMENILIAGEKDMDEYFKRKAGYGKLLKVKENSVENILKLIAGNTR